MSITFTCTCGKRMRVGDEMASRRIMCPACGRPVGVPSGQPTQRGAPVGPLSPEERRRRQRIADDGPTVVVPFLNDPLRQTPAAALTSPGPEAGSLRYRAVELPCEGEPAGHPSPAPRPFVPPVMEPPTYRVVQVADEVVQQERRRRLEDAREIQFRGRSRRTRRRSRQDRPLERHWSECLAYPFLTWRWLLGLAVLLSLVSAAAVAWLAEEAAPGAGFVFDPQSDFFLKWFFRVLFAGAAFSFVSSYLYWVISSAAAGEAPHGNWPVFNVQLWLRGVGCCLAALLAGPVELAVLGISYWMECGDLTFLDGIILAEMGVLGVGCGLFALAAVATRGGGATDLNPLRAFELAQRLGSRGALLVLFAAAAALAHGWLALGAIEKMHLSGNAFGGWLLLTLCWMSGLFVASFVLRVLGRWCAEVKPEEVLALRDAS